MTRTLFGLFLFAATAIAQVQVLAQPQIIGDDAFKHIRLQRWLLRVCNQDQAPRSTSDDLIYIAIPSVPFIPAQQAVEILQGKQAETKQALIAKYLGWGSDIAGVVTTSGRVAASSPIIAGIVAGMVILPIIQQRFQADVPSIGTLTENLLGYPAGTLLQVPAADSRSAGCTHAFAYSPKFSKKNPPPPNVQGTVK